MGTELGDRPERAAWCAGPRGPLSPPVEGMGLAAPRGVERLGPRHRCGTERRLRQAAAGSDARVCGSLSPRLGL